jgi:hypothetical protein
MAVLNFQTSRPTSRQSSLTCGTPAICCLVQCCGRLPVSCSPLFIVWHTFYMNDVSGVYSAATFMLVVITEESNQIWFP